MHLNTLSQLSLFLMIFICTSEIEACSCRCILAYPKIESLFESSNLGFPSAPDSQLKSYMSNHRRWFIGTVDSVISITNNTERIEIHIDSVLCGDIPFKSLSVQNHSGGGNCMRSAKSFENISFLGCMDSTNSPQYLQELGIFAYDCGIGVSGYFYKSGCLLRADVSESTTVNNGYANSSCSGPVVSIFSIANLFRVSIKAKKNTLPSNFIHTIAPEGYYSILGKKISKNESDGNSLIILKRQHDCRIIFRHRQ
jgi:hypothetical protein